MAKTDPTPTTGSTTYPAKSFELMGELLNVKHRNGDAVVPRMAVVEEVKKTFMDKAGARQESSVTCTFLENVGVQTTDQVTLPNGLPRAVLKVTVSLGDPGLRFDGFLTEVLLA